MDLVALKNELTTDVLARGYAAMSDVAAAESLTNVVDRPGDASIQPMLNYLLVNKHRTNTGTDTVNTSMLGRLIHLAQTPVGVDPFGGGTLATLDAKCSALALLEVVRNPANGSLPFQSATLQVLLTDMVNAGVMKPADRTAIVTLSNNRQSRAQELGFGLVTPTNVADARRLP